MQDAVVGDGHDRSINNLLPKRKLTRLKEYDYSIGGYYYITICTENGHNCLSEIKNGKIILNEPGKIVEEQWLWLQKQYSYVELDEYVIMPNHLHGILIINAIVGNGRDRSVKKIKSLSSLVGAFKTTSTKLIHQIDVNHFQWQKSFYDHIIRNEKSLYNIRKYISNNVLKWDLDPENIINMKDRGRGHRNRVEL